MYGRRSADRNSSVQTVMPGSSDRRAATMEPAAPVPTTTSKVDVGTRLLILRHRDVACIDGKASLAGLNGTIRPNRWHSPTKSVPCMA